MSNTPPLVTGLSPKEGVPGTWITIRGENFGTNVADLVAVLICDVDCTLTAKWHSPMKIVARCGQPKSSSSGDVIVITKSGGKGTSTVLFRSYSVQIGPLQESAVWIDESKILPLRQVTSAASPNILSLDDDPLNLPGAKSNKGPGIPDSELASMLPDGSGNLRLENFDPVWYLLENHSKTSYADLKKGLAHLKQNEINRREGPKDFLKSNLNSFICCLDALTELEQAIAEDTADSGGSTLNWTVSLEESVKKSRSRAETLFADVLGRKDQADATRNALSIMQRFKFLFHLPQNIQNNMEKKDYGQIINEYGRAKNYVNTLFSDTQIPLFVEAFDEVEKKMSLFKRTLREKLLEMPTPLEEQIKIIRYLSQLEPDEDPAWDCLCAQNRWIQNQLWDAQSRYLKLAKQESEWGGEDSDEEDRVLSEIPQRFHFSEAVFSMITSKIPPFWKLSEAYRRDLGNKNAPGFVENQDKIDTMLQNQFRLGAWLITNAVLPDALSVEATRMHKDKLAAWPAREDADDTLYLLNLLRSLRVCIAQLHNTDSQERNDIERLSDRHFKSLYELNKTIRLRCLNRIVEQTVESILTLQSKENWKVDNKNPDVAKTHLPDLFENMVMEIMSLVRTIVQTSPNCPSEEDLFVSFKSAMIGSFTRLLTSFKDTLELLSRVSADSGTGHRPTKLPIDGRGSKNASNKEFGVKDRKLLIVLSNCDYCQKKGLDNLSHRLSSCGVKYTSAIVQQSKSAYAALDGALRDAYVASKTNSIDMIIHQTDYSKSTSLSDVSDFVNEFILAIVAVKSELFLLTPHFLSQLLSRVVHNGLSRFCDIVAKQKTTLGSTARKQVDLQTFKKQSGCFTDQK